MRIRRDDFERLLEESYSGHGKTAKPGQSIWDGEIPAPIASAEADQSVSE